MRYKIKDIPDEGLVVDQAIGEQLLKDALEGMDADLGRSAASVRFDVHKVEDDLFVRGGIKATLGLPCGACLAPARADVNVKINMIYRLDEPEDVTGDSESDTEFGVHDGKWLDLEPMVREQLIMAVPMAPRCKESCKGLCPTCGQDRNQVACGHENQTDKEESPLAAALKNIPDLKV